MDITDDFGHWLAGFVDGEGCFHIDGPLKRSGKRKGGQYSCAFQLNMREDDRPILEEIQKRTGLGKIYGRRAQNERHGGAAAWSVFTQAGCVALIALLDRYPLRSRKLVVYQLWRSAVLLWVRGNRRPQPPGHQARWRKQAAETQAALTELRRVPVVESSQKVW